MFEGKQSSYKFSYIQVHAYFEYLSYKLYWRSVLAEINQGRESKRERERERERREVGRWETKIERGMSHFRESATELRDRAFGNYKTTTWRLHLVTELIPTQRLLWQTLLFTAQNSLFLVLSRVTALFEAYIWYIPYARENAFLGCINWLFCSNN